MIRISIGTTTMTTRALLPLLAAGLLGACGAQPATDANNTAIAAVEPQPGNAMEEVPADEGTMAGAPINATEDDDTGPAAPTEAAYLGRWIGVEGMYLNVAKKPGGGVTLDMQWDLDNKGKFDGSVTAEGLRFMRGGEARTAVLTDGDATGLKWLAGKKNCLTVKPGEGYCRN
ncbi:hypothetical protein [Sphingomonas sp. RS2018]